MQLADGLTCVSPHIHKYFLGQFCYRKLTWGHYWLQCITHGLTRSFVSLSLLSKYGMQTCMVEVDITTLGICCAIKNEVHVSLFFLHWMWVSMMHIFTLYVLWQCHMTSKQSIFKYPFLITFQWTPVMMNH